MARSTALNMPLWARSVFRVVVLMLLAYLAIAWAVESEPGPWGWGVMLGALALYLGLRLARLFRGREARRQAAWERAIYDDSLRARAIREVRRARSKLPTPPPDSKLDEYVRLSLSLAELLDANDDFDEAVQAADSIPLERLSRIDEGLVRHTRAVTRLRAGDVASALETLRGREPSGDRELDLRLGLLEAYARAEQGEAAAVLDEVSRIEGDSSVDPSVATEARVVMAAALDVMDQREDALVVLTPVGRSSLESVAHLGLPRVRALAREILRSTSSRPPAHYGDT